VKTNNVGDPTTNRFITSYTHHFPYHKAFSGDNTRVAVMNLPRTGGATLDNPVQTGDSQQFFGSGRSPELEVYPAAGPTLLGNLLFLGGPRTGSNHGGDGVDWHPTREEVVGAFRDDIPVTGTAGITGSEGTVLAIFSTLGGLDPFIRKLTRPSGRWDSYVDLFTSYLVPGLSTLIELLVVIAIIAILAGALMLESPGGSRAGTTRNIPVAGGDGLPAHSCPR
jgi:prepilin-type N-terminal cleavage/methylation domain-containing protein